MGEKGYEMYFYRNRYRFHDHQGGGLGRKVWHGIFRLCVSSLRGTEAICDRSRTAISIKMQGWGEYLLHELTMLYFIEEFHGNPEAVQVCMASRRYFIPV